MSEESAASERLHAERAAARHAPAKPSDLKSVTVPPSIETAPDILARPDPTRPARSVLIFVSAQTALFGAGAVLILNTSLSSLANWLIGPMITVTTILSAVAAWKVEPRLRACGWTPPEYGAPFHERRRSAALKRS